MSIKKLIFIFFCAVLLANPFIGHAQTTSSDQLAKLAQQQDLQNQLRDLQNQISQLQGELKAASAQKNTLANKIKQLKKQQVVLRLQVEETNLKVNKLAGEINDTQATIAQNINQKDKLKIQISGIIRVIDQSDSRPFVYSLMSQQSLSDVFSSYQQYAKVSQGLSALVNQLSQANADLQTQKDLLTGQQTDAQNLLAIKTLQQTQLSGAVNDQNNLLTQTKGKEADYQITLNDTKARAAEISGRIYQLLGISGQVTFGDAYKIALWAKGATGIDPAFLLAILTQESNLGKNVGTCNRLGDPASKSYKAVMKPDRDIQPFLNITASLGMNPDITPVSCAMKGKDGNQLGWGGAMGPAQFIPSTWVGYQDKVAALTGHNPANPWDIRDAFAAAAIKLTAGGADGTDQGNWNAAMRYFSGGTNKAYSFYGDNVLALTAKYQSDINSLGN